MPKLDIIALQKELAQRTMRPLYVLVGDEPFLLHEAFEALRIAVGEGSDIGLQSYSAREAKAEDVLMTLRTVPMLGGRPAVLLREGDLLGKESRRDLTDALTAYMEKPVESATLIIMGEKLDGRTRLMQLAAKQGAIVECKKMFDDKVPSWIALQVRKRGVQMSHEAARFLADLIGNDLGQIVGALDRIQLFIGERKMIELTDVEQAVAETHQRDIFDLTDAVGRRELATAMAWLQNLLAQGQPPPLILHMLARHFRILIKAREAMERMKDRGEIARYLGVSPFFLDGILKQARNFARSELRASFRVLSTCDRELKSSRLPRERILERAIVALTQKKNAVR